MQWHNDKFQILPWQLHKCNILFWIFQRILLPKSQRPLKLVLKEKGITQCLTVRPLPKWFWTTSSKPCLTTTQVIWHCNGFNSSFKTKYISDLEHGQTRPLISSTFLYFSESKLQVQQRPKLQAWRRPVFKCKLCKYVFLGVFDVTHHFKLMHM